MKSQFNYSRKKKGILLVVLCGLIIICGVLITTILHPEPENRATQLHELETAKAKWNAKQFRRYRMTVMNNKCQQEIEVSDEIIVSNNSSCQAPGFTVSDLFNRIEHDINAVEWSNGTGCDVTVIYPTYDPTLGFPQEIKYRQETSTPANTGSLTYFWYSTIKHFEARPCTLLALIYPEYSIKSLIPLP